MRGRAATALTIERRLGELPRQGAPLRARVVIHFDDHHVPFIEAEHDSDLAVALGVVHVHLRWAQIELMRRVALGRVAEMIGPPGIRIDHATRALGLAGIAQNIAATLPAETALWLKHFVAGINFATERIVPPPEFRILKIAREDWSIADVLALGRLAAADVTWLSLARLLRERDTALVESAWRRLVGGGAAQEPAPPVPGRPRRVPGMWPKTGGSNSLALAPGRSASGGALIASDPHLPAMLPNPFLIAGYRSPSFHVVGLMLAGLPFVALGRNPWIAWGSTNLHAASSDLFDLGDTAAAAIVARRERIRVRWWRDRLITIREFDGAPVVSDLALFRPAKRAFILRWMGRLGGDEITAMLAVNRARDWSDFRAALRSFAVPGQAMIYADAAGHIGKTLAAWLPRRPLTPPLQPILPPSAAVAWQSVATATDLPATFDPETGFVASANERVTGAPVPVGYLFSSDSRIARIAALLGGTAKFAVADLAALQQDTLVPWALPLRDDLVRRLREARPKLIASALVTALMGWDGRYDASSRGALAFELLMFHLAQTLWGQKRLALYQAGWNEWELLRADIAAAAPEHLAAAMRRAAAPASRQFASFGVWGEMHRLRPRHVLERLPVIGRRYRCGTWAAAGNSETVMKTAHPLTAKRHEARLAVSARHISDLADADRNFFVLLGGQDARPGSTTRLDQIGLWREGRYLQVPLRPETARRDFRLHVEILP